MKKLIMLAREVTDAEIKAGIGTEPSSTRLSPIFKTIDLKIPISNGVAFEPSIPIDPFQGTPLLMVPLLHIPHHESYLYGTPTIIEKVAKLYLQPTKVILDPGKGTGSPIIATAIESNDDDILILSPCDQYHSPAIGNAIEEILQKIEKKGFSSGTILTTGTKNPAFSYIRVKEEKAVEFILKGTIPDDDMIAETMIVCCKVSYLKEQLVKMKDVKLTALKKLFPYSEEELERLQSLFTEINELLPKCSTAEEYLKMCPFCDFSRDLHRILIDKMTYATVEYQIEWDDLGDWQKVFQSPIYPKDENGNLVFSKPHLITYSKCKNSVIANFTENKIIISDLNKRILAVGSRGSISIPLDMEPTEFKKTVVNLKM